jgi:hypothetical protein
MTVEAFRAEATKINPNVALHTGPLKALYHAIAPPAINDISLKSPSANLERALLALNALPLAEAQRYASAISKLAESYPLLIYCGVESFKATANSSNVQGTLAGTTDSDRKLRYSSATMNVDASCFVISAANVYELGLVQYCTEKRDIALYSGGSKMQDAHTGTFPVGDSSSESSAPWYHKGTQPGRANPTYLLLGKNAGVNRRLHLDDDFVNNFHFYKPQRSFNPALTVAETLTSIARKQAFKTWLVLRRQVSGKEWVLCEVSYYVEVAVDRKGNSFQVASTATATPVSTPAPGFARPVVAANVMNGMSEWRYFEPNKSIFKAVS